METMSGDETVSGAAPKRCEGVSIRLADITVPFLNIYGTYDHVTPPPSVTPLGELVGSTDSTAVALKAGHIGLLVGSSARKQTLPTVTGWLEARALAAASG